MLKNSCRFIGNATRNPEVRYVPGKDLAVVKFGVAVNAYITKDKTETYFAECVAFGKRAEFIGEYVTKGRLIAVDCRATTQEWEKDGVKHSRTVYVVEQLELMGKPKDGEKQGAESFNNDADMDGEDIPF